MTNERTTDLVKPYRVQLVHDDDDRLIGVNIRVADGDALDYDVIRDATRSLMDHFRREQLRAMPRRLRADSATLKALANAYNAGRGRVTEDYLAMLARSYSELVGTGVNIAETLAAALGGDDKPVPVSTVRTHIQRARREDFLTATRQGKEEGEPTAKALELVKPS